MDKHEEFVDLLSERRKDCDLLWVTRPMDPLLPHKLSLESKYSRRQMIEAVVNDERVKLAITSLAAAFQLDTNKVIREARVMVHEMASKAHLATVRWLGIVITKVLKRIFLSIYINEATVFRMKKEMQISQVQYVYAPSHRSYLDFILLSYILFSYNMALPNIASGMDFYQMYIIGEVLRKTGAFYMRRSFANDLLYKRVFQSYVMSLVKHSDRAIEFFIEGTRSRSLKSIVPKFGLLSTILESLLEGGVPDIHFVPISISYERPPEELLFAYELLGVPKPKEREKLAYCIIDSHKKNTILTPFNIIALLFNERSQMYPDNPYSLDSLLNDYLWCKNLLQTFGASIHSERSEILRLKERHKATKLKDTAHVKGHTLSERTMQTAVSVINISIYLNPTLSFLTNPAIVALAVGTEGVELDTAIKRYVVLRTILSTEFAMPFIEDETMIHSEWKETFGFLLRLNYISIQNDTCVQAQNQKVFSLLYNVLLPFIDAIYITYLVLFEWDESNDITIQAVSIEAQKRVEEAVLNGNEWGKHPYSLSLDLFNTTISNLMIQGILVSSEKRNIYQVDKIRIALLLAQLQSLSLKRPPGSYRNTVLLSVSPLVVLAKL
ncbi:Dihydroxyacetone phosphate acyltransferase [Dufourea novaeangliae]|uniref:Dihydroxyacetone phosphate acyltransferase n=1 Tax=Dufourea novaeangliae TaxID=178035 RepID=A0A154PHI2_DUFNO|nr:Dihydroxyacetone phosphate acyltransferase [Dufourea novaeangliae]